MSSLQEGASVPWSLGDRKRGQHHYRECEMYGRMVDAQMKDPEAFIGYVNYHREHIKSFAEIAAPLYTLKGPKTKFIWNKEKDTAFISLKEAMTNPAVLGYPTDDGMFILDTDASDMTIGAELSQIQCGTEVLMSFNSKTLTSTQRKYCVTRRELLAVVAFTRHYRYYLLGRPQQSGMVNGVQKY